MMESELEKLVAKLKELAGEGDMASIKINSDGVVYLKIGIMYEDTYTVPGFVAIHFKE